MKRFWTKVLLGDFFFANWMEVHQTVSRGIVAAVHCGTRRGPNAHNEWVGSWP